MISSAFVEQHTVAVELAIQCKCIVPQGVSVAHSAWMLLLAMIAIGSNYGSNHRSSRLHNDIVIACYLCGMSRTASGCGCCEHQCCDDVLHWLSPSVVFNLASDIDSVNRKKSPQRGHTART